MSMLSSLDLISNNQYAEFNPYVLYAKAMNRRSNHEGHVIASRWLVRRSVHVTWWMGLFAAIRTQAAQAADQ